MGRGRYIRQTFPNLYIYEVWKRETSACIALKVGVDNTEKEDKQSVLVRNPI